MNHSYSIIAPSSNIADRLYSNPMLLTNEIVDSLLSIEPLLWHEALGSYIHQNRHPAR
jgi:hypothetical protein